VEAVTQLTDDGEPKPFSSQAVTDGLRIYFNEGGSGSLKIAQVAVTGGSVAVIPTTVANPTIAGIEGGPASLLQFIGKQLGLGVIVGLVIGFIGGWLLNTVSGWLNPFGRLR
jgi:hypothetical protein